MATGNEFEHILAAAGLSGDDDAKLSGAKWRRFPMPSDLADAIAGYFGAISRRVPVMERVPVSWDKRGEVKAYEDRQAFSASGEPATQIEWFETPTYEGLLIHLGIGDTAWYKYKQRPGFREVTAAADIVFRDFWVKRAGQLGNTKGPQFILQCRYGYQPEPDAQIKQAAIDAERLGDTAEEQLTLAERVAFLQQVGGGLLGEGMAGGEEKNGQQTGYAPPSDEGRGGPITPKFGTPSHGHLDTKSPNPDAPSCGGTFTHSPKATLTHDATMPKDAFLSDEDVGFVQGIEF